MSYQSEVQLEENLIKQLVSQGFILIKSFNECVDNFVYSIPKLKNNNYLF